MLPNGQSSKLDLRKSTSSLKTYYFKWQTSANGYPVEISWNNKNLPAGSFYMTDNAGGKYIYNFDMHLFAGNCLFRILLIILMEFILIQLRLLILLNPLRIRAVRDLDAADARNVVARGRRSAIPAQDKPRNRRENPSACRDQCSRCPANAR